MTNLFILMPLFYYCIQCWHKMDIYNHDIFQLLSVLLRIINADLYVNFIFEKQLYVFSILDSPFDIPHFREEF